MKVLITGFAPFGGEKTNPSWEAVQRLPDAIDGNVVIKELLPVSYAHAGVVIIDLITKNKPDVVIAVGQAGGRSGITIERVAININDAELADNDGLALTDTPCLKDAPAAYFSTLPVKDIIAAIRAEKIPAFISNSAGTYVCNHVLYHALHHCAVHSLPIKTGFIHVPFLPEQVCEKNNTASMSLENIIRALEIAIHTCVKQ